MAHNRHRPQCIASTAPSGGGGIGGVGGEWVFCLSTWRLAE